IFKKTWFYYTIKIKNKKIIDEITISSDNKDVKIFITPKNIYNYCKSMIHYNSFDYTTSKHKYFKSPSVWTSLPEYLQSMFIVRFLDIEISENELTNSKDAMAYLKLNNWKNINWFSINNYFRIIYDIHEELPYINYAIHSVIKQQIIDII